MASPVDILGTNAMDAKFEFKQDNPKRCPSASYDRYEGYKAATSLREMLALGGTRADYKNDRGKGYIKLEGEAEFRAVAAPKRKPAAPSADPRGPRVKKVKGGPSSAPSFSAAGAPPAAPPPPKRAGFVIYWKVDSKMMSWDDARTFAGKTDEQRRAAQDETETAARRYDGMGVDSSTVYADLDAANGAALALCLKKVGDMATENAVVKPCEDMIMPSEGTIVNSCTKNDDGCATYRTAVHLTVDAIQTGAENLSRTSITVKTIYQSS